MSYSLTTTVTQPFETALAATRAALAEQGFGVLTEIDLAGTLRTKIGAEIPAQVILGACNPPLAHRALQAEESIGLLLPCNVTVRTVGDERTTVEAVDPQMMVEVTGNPALAEVAADAATRLRAALASLGAPPERA